jgi:uncharacterized protein (TIGR02246 family)
MDRERALDELLTREQIRELATRYSIAVDRRDVDAVAELFDEEVDNGRFGRGREATRAYYRQYFEQAAEMWLHQVANHQIDLVDDDHATGICYVRAVSGGDDGNWRDAVIVYFDTYLRRDGRWGFVRRRIAPLVRFDTEAPRPTDRFRLPEAWSEHPAAPPPPG